MKPLFSLCLSMLLCAGLAHAQTGFITPGDNLVTLNIPKIPASIADDVGRYTEFRSAGLASWHPTKREMLISTRFADSSQIHHVKFPGGARTQLTFFPDSVSDGSYQPKKGEFFLFSKGTGGNERFQIYRQDFSTGNVTLLTDGKSRNSGGIWSNSGDRIVYTSTKRNGADNDIYLMNPAASPRPQGGEGPGVRGLLLEVKGGGWFPAGWSPDDAQIIVGEYISINETYIWLVNAKSGDKTLVTTKGPEKIAYLGVAFAADGKGLYVTTDKDSEFQRLAHLDLATKKHTYLTDHIKWDIES
ncbi:MAG: hypothetical protein L0215_06925, partial [Gemmataceae bacterium]|nr:hypothetical protein [Gemmataceae bacterium]